MPFKLSNQLSGKKILVTGASGFIGSHLCQRLIAEDVELHAISRNSHADETGHIHWWKGDVADIATVRTLCNSIKPDVIYHLASHVMGAPDLKHVLPSFHSNLQTTINLLTVAAEIECSRIVLTGSLAEPEIGDSKAGVPSSPYAASKFASSTYARMFHTLYRLPVVILRVFMVYGPAQKDLSKLIPYVTLSLLQEKVPKITSGERLIDWIYVEDVVEGFIAAVQTPNIEGQTIDLGSGKLVSIRDIVRQVVDLMGAKVEPLFGALPDRPIEPTRVADINNTESKLAWKPSFSLKDGLIKTIDWYKTYLQ